MLRAMGIGPGDAFGLLSRNTFRNCELVHAGYWMGAIPVPVNIRLAPPEIEYILNNAGAKVIGIEDVFLELLDSSALAPWAGRAFCVSREPPEGRDLPHYEALIAGAEPAPLHDADPEDTAILLYTGGTTGRSQTNPA